MEIKLDHLANGTHEYDNKKKDIIDRGQLRVKDLIAPDAIENEPNHIKIGARFVRTIKVTGYPRQVRIGWLNRLYSVTQNIDISSHIEPVPVVKVIKDLSRRISQYISTMRSDMERGKLADAEIDIALDDAQVLRDKLHKGLENLYYQAIYISVSGKSEDELDQITDEIESLCGQMGMTTRHAMYEQNQGFLSVLPIAEDRLRHKRNFDTSSLATCFPIVSAELTDYRGHPIIYGINMINQSLVMFDRFKLPNYNSLTLATSGSGKSYFVKLEAMRIMAVGGASVIVIDPDGEYQAIADALGGQYIKLASSSKDKINIMDLKATNEEEDGTNFLTRKILDVYGILEVMLNREFNPSERRVVLSALEDSYKKYGITRSAKSIEEESYIEGERFQLKGKKKQMPTLTDLDRFLRKHTQGIQIAEELDPFIHGFLNLFNGETNVDMDARFVVIDIKDMEKQIEDVAMYAVLESVYGKIKSGDMVKRLLVVDEAWKLMKKKQPREFLVRVVKTARKFNGGLSMISQQATDFLNEDGIKIVGNTAMQILLKQHPNDLEDVIKVLKLSQNEAMLVKTAEVGEALIFAGGKKTSVRIVANDFEHIICSTKPEDKIQMEELKKVFMEKRKKRGL